MYEIHIVKNKNYPNEGCRVDKEVYEKYGLPTSIERSENEIHVNDDSMQVSYSGIEQILHEFCSFTHSMNRNLESPIEHIEPCRYAWTLPEEEIINIAAQHDVKIVFEDQLSLKTDFLNPANALEVTFVDGYYDEELNAYNYTVIPDYNAYKISQEQIAAINEKWKDFKGESYPKEYGEEICAACVPIRPEEYDAGARIYQALFALGGDTILERWIITYPHAIDDGFIKRAKVEHNLNISVK